MEIEGIPLRRCLYQHHSLPHFLRGLKIAWHVSLPILPDSISNNRYFRRQRVESVCKYIDCTYIDRGHWTPM